MGRTTTIKRSCSGLMDRRQRVVHFRETVERGATKCLSKGGEGLWWLGCHIAGVVK